MDFLIFSDRFHKAREAKRQLCFEFTNNGQAAAVELPTSLDVSIAWQMFNQLSNKYGSVMLHVNRGWTSD